MIKVTIAQRLSFLRKHLSERLGEDLSAQDLGEKIGLNRFAIGHMERGLKGNTETLIVLLRFYRKNGYNTDWIIADNNERIPIIMPAGRDLLAISETLTRVKQFFDTEHQVFGTQLRELGYCSFDTLLPEEKEDVVSPPDPLSL